nr:MAG TPA: hypothetical protein [Caudoviricetes sp.]
MTGLKYKLIIYKQTLLFKIIVFNANILLFSYYVHAELYSQLNSNTYVTLLGSLIVCC